MLHALDLRLGDGPDGGLVILSSRASLRDSFPSVWRMVRPFRGDAEATGGNLQEIIAAWVGAIGEP